MKVKFMTWDCIAIGAEYHNGGKSIILQDAETGEAFATATANLPNVTPPNDCVFVKEWSENEGMTQALVDAGIIDPTPKDQVQSGFVVAYAYPLTHKALEELFNV